MTLASTTPSQTRHVKSAGDLDVWKLVRLGVWLAFCILLIVLA